MARIKGKHIEKDQEVVITVGDFGFHFGITFDYGTKDAGNFMTFTPLYVCEFMRGGNVISEGHGSNYSYSS
jgi:hypothetical protein